MKNVIVGVRPNTERTDQGYEFHSIEYHEGKGSDFAREVAFRVQHKRAPKDYTELIHTTTVPDVNLVGADEANTIYEYCK